MRRSLKKIFRRHEDGTEHEYDDEEENQDGSDTRYSSEDRRRSRSRGRRSMDTSTYTSSGRPPSSRRGNREQQARLNDAPLSGAVPAADDRMVTNVLLQTRGQDGPVVRGMDDPDIAPGSRGYGGYASDTPPTIRAVNDDGTMNPRRSQDIGSGGIVQRKPVPGVPPKSQRRSIDAGRGSMEENPHFFESTEGPPPEPAGTTKGPHFYTTGEPSTESPASADPTISQPHAVDADSLPDVSRRAIGTDEAQNSASTADAPVSPTAAFYNVPERKPVRRSIDDGPTVANGVLARTPPQRSSLRNSVEQIPAVVVPNFSNPNPRASRDSLDDSRGLRKVGTIDSPQPRSSSREDVGGGRRAMGDPSLKKTGYIAPHGLMRIDSEDNRSPNIATPRDDAASSSASPDFATDNTTNSATSPHSATTTNTATSSANMTSINTSTVNSTSMNKANSASAGWPLTLVGKDDESCTDRSTQNVATFPNVASSTKMDKAPNLYTSPDLANSSNTASANTLGPTTTHKPNGTSGGWPLVAHTEDPLTTQLSQGKGHNVADGPIAAAFAEKYSEPDKFSRHVHVHKEETKVAKPVVHERIQKKVFHDITEKIERHIHTHEVHMHVQPIFDQQRLPDRHWVKQEDGSLTEISTQMAELLKLDPGYKEHERFEEVINHRGESNLDSAKFAGSVPIGSGPGTKRTD